MTFRQELILSCLEQAGGELNITELAKLCKCAEKDIMDDVLEIRGVCYRHDTVFIARNDWKDWVAMVAFPVFFVYMIFTYQF